MTTGSPREPSSCETQVMRSNVTAMWQTLSAVLVCTLASAGIPACAATGPYNPDNLGTDQVAKIANICQTTMGLSPKDRPVLGIYMGSPHLKGEVSHYQACIASLSDSVQSVSEAQAASQAHQDCRARGFQSNSPELAECVLQSFRARSNVASTQAHSLMVASHSEEKETRSVKSFFYASPRETRRREEMACAQLGLEPPYGAFASCVELLQDNFYAMDNPIS
jgi:hypothetical protein